MRGQWLARHPASRQLRREAFPAKAQGTDEEKWAVFQRVRDEIGARIKQLPKRASKEQK